MAIYAALFRDGETKKKLSLLKAERKNQFVFFIESALNEKEFREKLDEAFKGAARNETLLKTLAANQSGKYDYLVPEELLLKAVFSFYSLV
jgi:hypothetical protein